CPVTWFGYVKAVFNRVLCPSYQGFRIYRETLSRFSCAASVIFNNLNMENVLFSHLYRLYLIS
ncbi:hypothetical protein ACT6QE_10600, partial [Staphylococcus aureus]